MTGSGKRHTEEDLLHAEGIAKGNSAFKPIGKTLKDRCNTG